MTPPVDPAQGQTGRGAESQPAVSFCPKRIDTLRQRSDFLRAAQAGRQGTPGFLLQGRQRRDEAVDPATVRVGFTCSRKIGNAVTRNRAKRRLRAIARQVLPSLGRAGWDYVLVGRPDATVSRAFADLLDDLRKALTQIHARAAP